MAKQPNIIVILADDLGYGDLGCYGSADIASPVIDRLAAGGMRFTDFHSNGPVCSPTRAAMLTGRYQQRCGIEGVVTAANHRATGMPLVETTFAEVLKSAGYKTGLFGKWHLGYDTAFNPTRQGFDAFKGFVSGNVDYQAKIDQEGHEDWWQGTELAHEEGYITDLINDHGRRFIEDHHDQPFCLYLAHGAPHYPYQGPDDPAVRAAGNTHLRPGRTDRRAALGEMIASMDAGIGRVIDTLERLDLGRDTLVLFMSDNGPTRVGNAGPLRGSKGSLWEGGHRVPAIAYWPGRVTPASVSPSLAMTHDVLPTVAALGGAPLPEGYVSDGVDLSPVLLENQAQTDRTLYWRFHDHGAVRQGPWKWVDADAADHLFNLDDDLGEENDLAQARPEKLAELKALYAHWQTDVSQGVERRS